MMYGAKFRHVFANKVVLFLQSFIYVILSKTSTLLVGTEISCCLGRFPTWDDIKLAMTK
jgi:hypothetical protein